MIYLIFYAIIIYIIFFVLLPAIRNLLSYYYLKGQLTKLNKDEYLVLSNLNLPDFSTRKVNDDRYILFSKKNDLIMIDYLIISIYGIFPVKIKKFKKTLAEIRGNEKEKQITYLEFSRIAGAFAGPDQYQIENPVFELMKLKLILKEKFDLKEIEDIPYFPFVICIPSLKNISLRNRYETSRIISATKFNKTLKLYKDVKISIQQCQQIYKKLKDIEEKYVD